MNLNKVFCLWVFTGTVLFGMGQTPSEPIPLDLEKLGITISRSTSECGSCNVQYDCESVEPDDGNGCCETDEDCLPYAAYCCDHAVNAAPDVLSCELLETQNGWDCSGCQCVGDDVGWSSMFGCTDPDACNFDPDVSEDNGSCLYSEENEDCDGNCLEGLEIDCNGICGGTAEEDECGVCGGNGYDCDDNACLDDCPGIEGIFNNTNNNHGISDGSDFCDWLDGFENDSSCLDDCDEELLGDVQYYSLVCESCAEIDVCDELLADTENSIECEECGIDFNNLPDIDFDEDPAGFCALATDFWDNNAVCLINCNNSEAVDWAMMAAFCGDCAGSDIPDGACNCDGDVLDECDVCGGDSSTCTSWTELTAAGGDGQISLSWIPYDSSRGSRDVADGCELPDMNIFLTADGEVLYNSSESIGGFQFDVDGASPTSASGGDAALAGLFVQFNLNTVLGFHMTGGFVPAGCGTLVNLTLDGEAAGLSGIVVSDAFGESLSFLYYIAESQAATYSVYKDGELLVSGLEGSSYTDSSLGYSESHCYTVTYTLNEVESAHSDEACATTDDMAEIEGCMDETACNYDSEATIDDGSCELPQDNYDCDGNCSAELDECGICGGDSSTCTSWTELTAAGGDSQISLSWTAYGSGRGSRDVTDGCDLLDMNIFLTADGEVLYNSSESIGGFQFNVDGATINSASGGDAAAAGLFMQASGSTLLAFSMTGGSIAPGCGTLASLSLSGDATGLSDIVVSNATGGQLPFLYYGTIVDCMDGGDTDYTYTFGDGADGTTACNYNPDATEDGEWAELCTYPEQNYDCDGNCIADVDCAGICGGDTEVDECGVCGGSGGDQECGCEGIPDDDCDCDGNTLDCAGECGGAALEDVCGVCGGPGADSLCWDGSYECDAGDCPEESQAATYSVYKDGELLVSGLEGPSYTDSSLGYSESHCYTVTYTLNEVESAHSDEACATTDDMAEIEGCMDETACNYDSEATMDSGECEYAEYECWNGDIVCDGSDCPFEPGTDPFTFNQSSSQAFYHIMDAYDLNGNPLVAGEDWIAVFKGDVCVGARLWTEDATTDIPAMGDDGFSYSEGYLLEGELPSFKIFDVSENQVIDAFLSDQFKFSNNQVYLVNTMKGGIGYRLPLNNYHNLVSFYSLPDDVSPAGMTFGISSIVHSLIAEGESAINISGEWSGSLTALSSEKGYWVSIDTLGVALFGAGLQYDPERVYDLHEGPNLISYSDTGVVDLSSAIPDDLEDSFIAILSEGKAAYNTDAGWVGTLTTFEGGSGYWVISDADISFSYNIGDNMARIQFPPKEALPDDVGFKVHQSPLQAFYFIDNIALDEGGIELGDWILAYNGDVLAGIRQWHGEMVDVPVMGSYEDEFTAGYFLDKEVPIFKVLKKSTGSLIDLDGMVPEWASNGVFLVNSLSEKKEIPAIFGLNDVYPNPFNPVTSIQFSMAVKSSVSIQVFDMQGRLIDNIISDAEFNAGYHQVQWNAEDNSTGIYIIKMSVGSHISTRKLMLIK